MNKIEIILLKWKSRVIREDKLRNYYVKLSVAVASKLKNMEMWLRHD